MPKGKKSAAPASATSANVGYEAQLWQMADALRGSMDAAEYKHEILHLTATARENIEVFSHLADSGGYSAVRHEVVVASRTTRAGSAVIEAFSRAVETVTVKGAASDPDSRTLAALRDALLPKLVSGELRVQDADNFVGATV